MKYIRTKDAILEIENISKPIYVKGKGEVIAYHFYDKQNNYKVGESLNKNINQADTIDELCDKWVYDTDEEKNVIRDMERFSVTFMKNAIQDKKVFNVKLAIFTDKGLIYVAKLNEKGELELL